MRLVEIKTDTNKEIWHWIGEQVTHFGVTINVVNDEITYFGSDFNVDLKPGTTHLPYKFGKCDGDFLFTGASTPLESLENCPITIGQHDFTCSCSPLLKSLKGVSQCDAIYAQHTGIVDINEVFPHLNSDLKFLSITGNDIKNWTGVHKICKVNIKELHVEFNEDTIGGIGLLLIPGLKHLDLYCWKSPIAHQAALIIEKYVGHPHLIYDCQAELIDNSLDKFAEM